MATLLDNLVAALPLIACQGGGRAGLTDLGGHCLCAVDRQGAAVEEAEPAILSLCRIAAETGETQSLVDPASGVAQVAVPLEGYVLFVSNVSQIERQNELFNTLKETLPLIARVAGGEAVLFDKDGRRILTADPILGKARVGPGTISEPCGEVMRSGRPSIGPSRSAPGAMAVRIPMGSAFGFGFNNSASVRQKERLLEQVKDARTGKYSWEDIVGSSAELGRVIDLAKKVAPSNSSVMLTGESGTGKELFAQAIHNASARSHGPFVAINCSALPGSLVESSLFGYEEGAFTGAQRGGRAGLFEQARGGTLLLDEISEMPLETQAKLLRVLQEREVCRIGSAKPIPVDVRIIATSNRDVKRRVEDGSFRQDLYYRLNVIELHLPPLRERREDIPEIVARILDRLCRQNGHVAIAIEPRAMERLKAYDWPGNCRELHNVLERAINLTGGGVLEPHHFAGLADDQVSDEPAEGTMQLAGHLAEAEQTVILEALKRNGGRRVETARELGISVTTLWRRLKRMRLEHHVSI
ncbi:MAG: sigma 54-interacting transcriptional regulator [Alphaproteobacteria bacterium]|nr:sigma 54-interacting transcriptional regulator [Alphaproteobacteria bacterium]